MSFDLAVKHCNTVNYGSISFSRSHCEVICISILNSASVALRDLLASKALTEVRSYRTINYVTGRDPNGDVYRLGVPAAITPASSLSG